VVVPAPVLPVAASAYIGRVVTAGNLVFAVLVVPGPVLHGCGVDDPPPP